MRYLLSLLLLLSIAAICFAGDTKVYTETDIERYKTGNEESVYQFNKKILEEQRQKDDEYYQREEQQRKIEDEEIKRKEEERKLIKQREEKRSKEYWGKRDCYKNCAKVHHLDDPILLRWEYREDRDAKRKFCGDMCGTDDSGFAPLNPSDSNGIESGQ